MLSVLLSVATLFKCTNKLAFSEKKNQTKTQNKRPRQNNLALTATNTHPPRTSFGMLLSNLDEIYASIHLGIRNDVLN